MDIIDHSLNWCRGEIFEGKMSILFGMILLAVSLAFFKWGSTPYAKAMFWPLLLISILALGAGGYLLAANNNRIKEYPVVFEQGPIEFATSEKQRTEAFMKGYPITFKVLFGLVIVGMLCLLLSKGASVRTIGIGLLLFGFYGFVLDHFSEERATTYHTHIINFLNHQNL